ncbi:hypothetical protein ACE5IS_02410 [Leptospira wolffii]|uniref:Lipoprotein n=1 Tax=Leptospira wolffii TaxID=409998 RepID=A0ABV5BK82_9LEPT|nr:hypothetical protein [Leptospira wolffii]TGL49413.1 hypothetical protein EHQ61_13265 [Leptospira wolffii]
MKVRIFVALCLSFFILADCAVLQKKNRTITNYLDEKVDPKSAPAQIALAPLFIPVGLVSLVLDAFVVHPISVIPDAVEDTYKVIWKDPSGGVVFQTVVFFPKLAITPIFFLVDFLGRSGIDF